VSGFRTAAYVDYQQRASEFAVGDLVYPFFSGNSDLIGRVMAVWPAIGMVDVEWPHGSERYPVEDLQQYQSKDYRPPDVGHDNIPGGAGAVSVPGGPAELPGDTQDPPRKDTEKIARVARAFVKRALYWASKDRQYRATRGEVNSGNFMCPKCGKHPLRPAVYKRRDGQSVPLMGCRGCLFLIKQVDIIGHPSYDDGSSVNEPFAQLRVGAA